MNHAPSLRRITTKVRGVDEPAGSPDNGSRVDTTQVLADAMSTFAAIT
jgi:hypothetical protein